MTFEEAQADGVSVVVSGDRLPVIGLASLRANKKPSGRKNDRDDLKQLPVAATKGKARVKSTRDVP